MWLSDQWIPMAARRIVISWVTVNQLGQRLGCIFDGALVFLRVLRHGFMFWREFSLVHLSGRGGWENGRLIWFYIPIYVYTYINICIYIYIYIYIYICNQAPISRSLGTKFPNLPKWTVCWNWSFSDDDFHYVPCAWVGPGGWFYYKASGKSCGLSNTA